MMPCKMGMSVWRDGSMVSNCAGAGRGRLGTRRARAGRCRDGRRSGRRFIGLSSSPSVGIRSLALILGGGFEGAFLGGGGLAVRPAGMKITASSAARAESVEQRAPVALLEGPVRRTGFSRVRGGRRPVMVHVALDGLLERLDDLLADRRRPGPRRRPRRPGVGLVLIGEHRAEDHDEQHRERDGQEQRAPVREKLREVGAVEFAESRRAYGESVADAPAGEFEEHVFQRGRVDGQAAQFDPALRAKLHQSAGWMR